MVYIFLDIDGVLNSTEWEKKCRIGKRIHEDLDFSFCPAMVTRLWNTLRELPDIKVVLSSSWRFYLREVNTRLGKAGFGMIIDEILPGIEDYKKYPDTSRGVLIRNYLQGNEKYIIIDDDLNLLESQYSHLVRPNSRVGLTEEDCDNIKELYERFSKV